MKLHQSELENKLLKVTTAKPVTFVATTDAHANRFSVDINPKTQDKDPNPYEKILKKSRVNGFIAYDYEDAVNRQRAREGKPLDFVQAERKHGERVSPAVSETNGVRKMVVKVQAYLDTTYFGVIGSTMKPLTSDEAKKFIRDKTKSKSQGVEKLVDHKEYNISNIEEITIDGEHFEIVR